MRREDIMADTSFVEATHDKIDSEINGSPSCCTYAQVAVYPYHTYCLDDNSEQTHDCHIKRDKATDWTQWTAVRDHTNLGCVQ